MVTEYASDGDLGDDEKANLKSEEEQVSADMKALAENFDKARRDGFTPIHKEVMNEAFFVFSVSAYARRVIKYSEMLRTDPPQGESFVPMVMDALRQTISCENV